LRFFSLTKADRILKRSDFLQLSQHGKKISNAHFVLLYAPGQFEKSRLGITVTKKVGNAVVRNRIKRFSREYFRLNRHKLRGYWDINIIARQEAADLSTGQAFISLENVFDRIEAT
jgi:ribonuclease P protein component